MLDILISEELDSPAIQKLSAKYKVVRDGRLWQDPAKLKMAIAEVRAILVRNQTQLTAEILAAASRLIGIGRVGVGLDNIDLPAASKAGIVVIAPLEANATSVAELTLAFLLALARKIPQADRSTKAGGWDRKGCTGIELEGKTLAICGFGRIGRRVALLARAFGMKSLVFDPFVKPNSPSLAETGASLANTLEEVLAVSDFVTTHSPLTPETRRMFNAAAFTLMKPGAFFINTSRGGVVDEAALLEALRSGHLGGAALDVREKEPPGERTGLEQMDNVILAPHIGAFTAESQTRTFEAVATDVDRLLSGEPAINFVNMARPART
ncbi:MAG TPA: hydroxyacid dehydrogenase [Candidatus Saccharimonadales bacterium]|nr:hydroxyacid dehydrogenase [Candidatus Saccharimonadales bacterium]